jgi:dynein heavy chain, axonemal
MKFHYIFNLRDLSRIYEGLCRSTEEKFKTKDKFLRLWRNECMRVFMDRLITPEDRKLVGEKLFSEILRENFSDSHDVVMQEPLLIGDYMLASPADADIIDP